MFKDSIDISSGNSKKISQKMEQVTFNAVRKILPDHSIIQACKSTGYTYRERKITPIVTVLHMIMAAIWPEDSFNASWQVIWANFASWFPSLSGQCPARTNVARARARLPIEHHNIKSCQKNSINGRNIALFWLIVPVSL